MIAIFLYASYYYYSVNKGISPPYTYIVIVQFHDCYYWTKVSVLLDIPPCPPDTAEVIQSRLNEQEGREEFYVHYVGCEYLTHYRCACDSNSPLHLYHIVQ